MARLRKDLTGKKFGRLLVIRRAENKRNRTAYWCKCDCGKECIAIGMELTRGSTKSCGCLKKELAHKMGAGTAKHRMHGSRIYKIWIAIRQRCNCKSARNYHNYGGRGIKLCTEWDDFMNFYNWAMSHGYNDSLTIDRIDVNGNYEPSNCRWADDLTQHNNRRDNVFLEFHGKKMTIAEWAKKIGIPYPTLRGRLGRGWPVEKALTTPSSTNRSFSYQGKTMGLAAWGRETGIGSGTLWARLQTGWSFERAITTPVRKIKHSQ